MCHNCIFIFDVSQKITLEDLSESKSAIEEKSVKSGENSHSVNSIQTATQETTNVAVYEVGWLHVESA